jgi:hypothetical protein
VIDKVLTFLANELNTFLLPEPGTGELAVVLSGLAEADGSLPARISNKLAITVTNIERETIAFTPEFAARPQPGGTLRMNPPLNLNLYVLLSVSATEYLFALRLISGALGFIQSKSVFTPQNSPGFPGGLERFTLEIVNLSVQDLQNLWASTGAKYLPSVCLKIRMLAIQDAWIAGRQPIIQGTDARTRP